MRSAADVGRSMMFTEEPPRIDDLVELQRVSISNAMVRAYTDTEVLAWIELSERAAAVVVEDRDWETVSCLRDEQLVGFMAYKLNGTLGSLYVHPGTMGRGLGSALLDRFEAAAMGLSVGRVVVDASLNSVNFYRKHGYNVESHVCYRGSTHALLPAMRMNKLLTSRARNSE